MFSFCTDPVPLLWSRSSEGCRISGEVITWMGLCGKGKENKGLTIRCDVQGLRWGMPGKLTLRWGLSIGIRAWLERFGRGQSGSLRFALSGSYWNEDHPAGVAFELLGRRMVDYGNEFQMRAYLHSNSWWKVSLIHTQYRQSGWSWSQLSYVISWQIRYFLYRMIKK